MSGQPAVPAVPAVALPISGLDTRVGSGTGGGTAATAGTAASPPTCAGGSLASLAKVRCCPRGASLPEDQPLPVVPVATQRRRTGFGEEGIIGWRLPASRWLAVFVLAPLLLTCLPPAQAPAYAVAGACVPATSPAYAPLPVPASEAQPTGTPSPATSLVEAEGLQLWTRFPARGAK